MRLPKPKLIPTAELNTRLKGRIFILLIAVICLNLAAPLIQQDNILSEVYVLTYCFMLGFGVFVASSKAHRIQTGVGGTIVTLILIVRASFFPENISMRVFALLVLVLFQVYIILILLEFMFESEKVDREVLYASIVIYLLIANSYAALHASVSLLQPEAYQFSFLHPSNVSWPNFLYFSFATITTLGFGDIVPVGSFAAVLTASEAVIGVLYLTVMMARLVGLYAQDIR